MQIEITKIASGLGVWIWSAAWKSASPNLFFDWFYAFAKCDFDRDGVFWEFTTAHWASDVSMGDTNFGE